MAAKKPIGPIRTAFYLERDKEFGVLLRKVIFQGTKVTSDEIVGRNTLEVNLMKLEKETLKTLELTRRAKGAE